MRKSKTKDRNDDSGDDSRHDKCFQELPYVRIHSEEGLAQGRLAHSSTVICKTQADSKETRFMKKNPTLLARSRSTHA